MSSYWLSTFEFEFAHSPSVGLRSLGETMENPIVHVTCSEDKIATRQFTKGKMKLNVLANLCETFFP